MSRVLRRIETPTRYGGLPLKGWVAAAAVFAAVVALVSVVGTPLAPTLVFLAWFVVSPALLAGMWAHQQGVSVATLIGDVFRYSLRRSRTYAHRRCEVLRGGVVVTGALIDDESGGADVWSPAVDLDEALG